MADPIGADPTEQQSKNHRMGESTMAPKRFVRNAKPKPERIEVWRYGAGNGDQPCSSRAGLEIMDGDNRNGNDCMCEGRSHRIPTQSGCSLTPCNNASRVVG